MYGSSTQGSDFGDRHSRKINGRNVMSGLSYASQYTKSHSASDNCSYLVKHDSSELGFQSSGFPLEAKGGSGKKKAKVCSSTVTSSAASGSGSGAGSGFSQEADSGQAGNGGGGGDRGNGNEKFSVDLLDEETETAEEDGDMEDGDTEDLNQILPGSQLRSCQNPKSERQSEHRDRAVVGLGQAHLGAEEDENSDDEGDTSVVPGSVDGKDNDVNGEENDVHGEDDDVHGEDDDVHGEDDDAHEEGDGKDQVANENLPARNESGGKFVWRSAKEVSKDTFPLKSKEVYKQAYKQFERFLKAQNRFVEGSAPSEEDFLNYFTYLKVDRHFAPNTIWCTSAKLNACVKREYGFKLQDYPSVSELLKSFDQGHIVKKAKIFTPQEVLYILLEYFCFFHLGR
jgi:hypothetical protein